MKTIQDFLKATAAGATAVTAAVVVVMTVAASTVIIEHHAIVDQRDTLKSAANAASIAMTAEMHRVLSLQPNTSDDALTAFLRPIGRRYVELNLMHLADDRRRRAMGSLVLNITLDRNAGTLDVDAAADMGGFIMAQALPLFGKLDDAGPTEVRSGVEQAPAVPFALVLALDYSTSMRNDLQGRRIGKPRVEIVKDAATALAEHLLPNDQVTIGLVPWADRICRDASCTPQPLALTGDLDSVRRAIAGLSATGPGTFSTSGLTVSTTMLQAVPPGIGRGIILLTDGDDTICEERVWGDPSCTRNHRRIQRADACQAAKNADIVIWVIAAMPPWKISGRLGRQLRACSSEGDDSGRRYVFLEQTADADIAAAFEDIGRQLQPLRRVY